MNRLKSFLSGKSVVLVGPASTLRGQRMGEFIDSHDVVVRLNHALPLPEKFREDIGTRTDILYHNLNPKKQRIRRADVRKMRRSGVKWIISTHPTARPRYRARLRNVRRASRCIMRVRAVPKIVKRLVRPHVGTANSGIVAVVDLLRYPIDRLYVTGFSFYKTGYLNYPKYRRSFIRNALRHHNQRRHKAYLARLVAKDPRLEVDPFIAHLLRKQLEKYRKQQQESDR